MTRDELIQKLHLHRQRVRRVGWVYLAFTFVTMLAMSAVADAKDGDRISRPVGMGLAALLIAPLVPMSWHMHRSLRESGLRCPSCPANLVGSLGRIAVATGKCGDCGATIVED